MSSALHIRLVRVACFRISPAKEYSVDFPLGLTVSLLSAVLRDLKSLHCLDLTSDEMEELESPVFFHLGSSWSIISSDLSEI